MPTDAFTTRERRVRVLEPEEFRRAVELLPDRPRNMVLVAGGRPFRTFNMVDDYSRECLVIEAASSLPAARVVRVLEVLTAQRGRPEGIVLDNGTEFIPHAFLRWAARLGPRWTSSNPVSLSRMRSSKASTASFETSV